VAPPGSNWELQPNDSSTICLPNNIAASGCGWSGIFSGRTGCQFDALYNNPVQCATASDCPTSTAGQNPYLCYGGLCMFSCTIDSVGAAYCQSANGLNNSSAICGVNGVGVCGYPQGTVCQTGDCAGLLECAGSWDSLSTNAAPQPPAAAFEPTVNSASNVNYDVTLNNGYNGQMSVTLPPSVIANSLGNACQNVGCSSDLLQTCPTLLQVTQAPSSGPGPIACGSGFCQSGLCVGNTCLIACNQPFNQCTSASPPAGLMCNSVLASGATNADMYAAKDYHDTLLPAPTPTPAGVAMASCNQGTPTCWGNTDCLPGEQCVTTVPSFPAGAGVCSPSTNLQTNCTSQADVGNLCGGYNPGYANALGYSCVSVGGGAQDVACVPPTTSGLGSFNAPAGLTPLFSGCGGVVNDDWVSAGTLAGGGTPYYQTFSAACPQSYAWQYDDHVAGHDCNVPGSTLSFAITFGPQGP
jgi:hypothetical protein